MFDLPPPDPAIEISLAGQGMSKGLRQTDGPQIVIRPEMAFSPIFVGAQYRNLSSLSADGELWGLIGLRGEAGSFDLSASVIFKRWIATTGRPDRDAIEFNASVSRPLGAVTPRLAIYYSPNDLGSGGASFYVEGGATLGIAPDMDLFVNASRRERTGGPDYSGFNAGVSYGFLRHLTADLRYYDTTRSGIDETYRGRLVVRGVHFEPGAPPETRERLGGDLASMAEWLGLEQIEAWA